MQTIFTVTELLLSAKQPSPALEKHAVKTPKELMAKHQGEQITEFVKRQAY